MMESLPNYDQWKLDENDDGTEPDMKAFDDLPDADQDEAIVGWAKDEAWELAELIGELADDPRIHSRANWPAQTIRRMALELGRWKQQACKDATE